MKRSMEFFFDYVSPATYLAFTQLPAIAERTGAEIIYKPFLLGGVFKSTGNSSPMVVPAKGVWLLKDLERYAKRYQLKMNMNPHFPFNSVSLMRGACWALDMGNILDFSKAMFRAIWVEQRNMSDPLAVAEVLQSISIDPEGFLEVVNQQEYKDKLRTNTEEAVARGAFGAPTIFVGDELFWGQDRLDFVEEALNRL